MRGQQNLMTMLLATVAGAMALVFGVQQFVLAPIEDKKQERLRAEKSAQTALTRLNEARLAAAELDDMAKLCLPGDPREARKEYEAFLLEILQVAEIPTPTITPGPLRRLSKSGDLHALPIAVDIETDIWSLAKFLLGFYQAPRLHQIMNLSLTPVERKDIGPALRVSLTIEAIGLGEEREPLRPSEIVYDVPVDGDREAYGVLVEKNVLFASGPGSIRLRANDPEHVVLMSIWHQGETVDADLFDRAANSVRRVRIGEECTVGRTRAVVVDMGLRDLVLMIDGNLYQWEIGTTFDSRQLLSAEEALDREVRNRRRFENMN